MDRPLTRRAIDKSAALRATALIPKATLLAVVAAILLAFTLFDVLEPAYISACVAAGVAVAWALVLDRQS